MLKKKEEEERNHLSILLQEKLPDSDIISRYARLVQCLAGRHSTIDQKAFVCSSYLTSVNHYRLGGESPDVVHSDLSIDTL